MGIVQAIIVALYFIFGGMLLFLAYSIIRSNIANRLNRITGLMLFFAALGPIFLALGAIVKPIAAAAAPFEESVVYNLLYIWELFFPALLLFSWAFPLDRLSRLRRPALKYLIFLPHIFHLLLVVVFNNPEKILGILDVRSGAGFFSLIIEPLTYLLKWVVLGFTIILSSEKSLFSLINLIYAAIAIYSINRGRAAVANVELKNQSTIIIRGLSLAVGLYAVAFLLPDILSFEVSQSIRTSVLIIALFVGGGSIIWSIITHQFLDVTVLVRQSLVYTISSGILVGAYILLVSQAEKLISSVFGQETAIVNIAFIVVALMLYQPINVQLDNLIKRFFVRSRTDYRNVMEELSRRLISVLEPEQLRTVIEKTLVSGLLIEKVYFVLYDDKLGEYVLISSEDFPGNVIIERTDLFLGGVGQLDRPAMIERLSLYSQGSNLHTEIEKRRARLILPLKDADHLLGFLALTEKISGFRYNAEDLTMLGVLSNQLVTALTNARLYQDSLEKQRLHEEMTMARQIQLDLLPKEMPFGDDFEIYACSFPSRTIGGDFYDFIRKEDKSFGVVIADASGKGLPAALLVTQIQAMMRSEIDGEKDISQAVRNINQHVAEMTSSEKFATLFYGEFNPNSREFHYANAGHNYPLLVRSDGSFESLSRGGILIGAFPGAVYEKSTVRLEDDDLLFLYTDGLSEAMNGNNEEFGEKRIIDFIIKNRHLGARQIADGILEDKKAFDPTDPPRDDTTLIVLKAKKGKAGE